MINSEKFGMGVRGAIELSFVKDGVWTPFHRQSNLVVNNGCDIMAAAVAGLRTVNGMYICFENSDTTKYTAGEGNNAEYYNPATPVPDRSFVRVSTLGEPIIETSDGSAFEGNKITFLGVTDGSSFISGVPLTDSVSVLYHSALISTLENGEQADDYVFSCADFSTPVTKIAGSQLGVRWELVFNNA